MNVLVTMPFSPLPPDSGGALRLYYMLQHLSRAHRVSLITFHCEPDRAAAELKREFDLDEVRVLHHDQSSKLRVRAQQLASTFSLRSYHQGSLVTRRFQAEIDAMFERRAFEVLHTEFSHLGPVTAPAHVHRVCDAHNVEYDIFTRMARTVPSRLRRAHYWVEQLKVKRDEIAWCNTQDVVLTTSDRDREVFQQAGVRVPIEVMPNGVDTRYFVPGAGPTEPHSLVFTGAMHYTPNYDGIIWFVNEVLPLIRAQVPQVKLYVVGKDPPPHLKALASDSVVLTGLVPDVRGWVHRASVYVVPLRIGGGTRLKVCEAMAMKKPMVSTRLGAEGIAVEDERTILLADAPEQFAAATVRLLGDAALQQRLADAAFELVNRRYTWQTITAALDPLYASLAEVASRRSHAQSPGR